MLPYIVDLLLFCHCMLWTIKILPWRSPRNVWFRYDSQTVLIKLIFIIKHMDTHIYSPMKLSTQSFPSMNTLLHRRSFKKILVIANYRWSNCTSRRDIKDLHPVEQAADPFCSIFRVCCTRLRWKKKKQRCITGESLSYSQKIHYAGDRWRNWSLARSIVRVKSIRADEMDKEQIKCHLRRERWKVESWPPLKMHGHPCRINLRLR